MIHGKLILSLTIMFMTGWQPVGESKDKSVPQEIKTAWLRRAKLVDGFEMTWRAKVGHHSQTDGPVETNEQFVLDQADSGRHRWRLSIMSIMSDPFEGVLQDQGVVTSTGTTQTTLYDDEPRVYPFVSIKASKKGFPNYLQLMPIRLAYFCTDFEREIFENEDWEQPVETRWNNTDCLLLRAHQKMVWVTNDTAFLPVRYVVAHQGSEAIRYDFRLEFKEELQQGIPVLKGWSFENLSQDGKTVVDSREVVMTTFSPNADLTDDLFTQRIPHGTWVNDSIAGESYIARDNKPK